MFAGPAGPVTSHPARWQPLTCWDLLDPLVNYIFISRVSGTYGRTLIETVHQALFGAPAEQTAALTTLEHPLLRSPSRDTNAAAGFAAVAC